MIFWPTRRWRRMPTSLRCVGIAQLFVAAFAMWSQKVIRISIVGIFLFSFAAIKWGAFERARDAQGAPESWKQLRSGMSSQEVVLLIGHLCCCTVWAPVPTAPVEDWYYAFSGTNVEMPFGRNVVTFKTGTVTRVEIR